MRHGLRVAAVGVGLFGLLAAPALACGPGGPPGEELAARRAEFFAQADGNGDGALDMQEFQQFHDLVKEAMVEARFTRLDTNADGTLSAEELQNAPRRHWRGGPGRGPR